MVLTFGIILVVAAIVLAGVAVMIPVPQQCHWTAVGRFAPNQTHN